VSLEEKFLSIKSLDDVIRCVNLASLLELSGYPKPGNIHRTKDFKNTRFEHFLAGIASVQPNFREFCENIYDTFTNAKNSYRFIQLGLFFKKASTEMMRWQNGGNVILGHILILAPLAAAAIICLKNNTINFNHYINTVNKVVEDTTVEDTVNLYEAIRICNPGGLGKVKEYDLNDENAVKDIQRNNVTLKKIFELSKEYDSISSEYATGFTTIFNEGLPYFFYTYDLTQDINISTVNTFLKLLSEHPDTLIIRKSGEKAATIASKKAAEVIKMGGILSSGGVQMVHKLDAFLQAKEGQMNPGTTADILAGVIFSALIFGLKF
jgi:triphosphoribosyl-dephospho-CoA synthase